MLICVTMYSEEKSFLEKTLRGIHLNIKYFEMIGVGSEQIGIYSNAIYNLEKNYIFNKVVVVIQDGIMKMKVYTFIFLDI